MIIHWRGRQLELEPWGLFPEPAPCTLVAAPGQGLRRGLLDEELNECTDGIPAHRPTARQLCISRQRAYSSRLPTCRSGAENFPGRGRELGEPTSQGPAIPRSILGLVSWWWEGGGDGQEVAFLGSVGRERHVEGWGASAASWCTSPWPGSPSQSKMKPEAQAASPEAPGSRFTTAQFLSRQERVSPNSSDQSPRIQPHWSHTSTPESTPVARGMDHSDWQA